MAQRQLPRAILSYRDLDVWQVSMQLVAQTYRLSRSFPKVEAYGLTSQIRRAAVSVPSNIAEGYGRAHRGEYVRFLAIANGSLKEVETQTLVAQELGYVQQDTAASLLAIADRVGRMLAALIRKLRIP